ncbi:MAG: hypothetical protein NTZ21_09695 [Actinobacteria bacterium]|nr:hypothetical protein [Actinomycetota bacterium]
MELPAKTTAVYDFTAKNVLCLACRDSVVPAPQQATPSAPVEGTQRQQDRRVGDRRRSADATESSRGGSVLERDS